MISIIVFDGADTIGGNKIYLEESSRGVFLDFGLNFAKSGRFFQEFLTERSSRGIHDLIHLGIVPQISCYRKDLIPVDVDTSSYSKINPEAVILSHAHMDHCGHIGLLDASIPIVASSTSIAILKAWRDSSPASIGNEIAYLAFKTPVDDCDGYVLESDRKQDYVCRDFYSTSPHTDSLREFLSRRPGQDGPRAKQLMPGALEDYEKLPLPFKVTAYPVDHSIYGSNGYLLEGDTTIAYSGDIRVHGKNADMTRKFIQAAKNASVLIIEGTRIGREESVEISEQDVYEKCREAVESIPGLVVADFGARNFERLDTFMEIAENTGRQLVVTAKDAYMLHALSCVEGTCRMDQNLLVYEEMKSRTRVKWETEVVLENWGAKYISPETIHNNPDKVILCFSFFDLKHLLDIKPESGGYVYSSSEAYTEEQEIDFIRLNEWLRFFGLKPYGFTVKKQDGSLHPLFEKEYHASGHLSMNDLHDTITEINPDKLVPVHTEHPEWFKENFPQMMT